MAQARAGRTFRRMATNLSDRSTIGHPSAQFSATLRVHLQNRPGSFAAIAEAIADEGGLLDAIDLVRVEGDEKVRDVTVLAADADQLERIAAAVRCVDGVEVEHVSDRTFLLHLGGKLEVVPKTPLKTRDDLSMAYTPGVARVSRAIADDPAKAWALTIKQNTVAVVSDGTAVLGLGDVGPAAAMPVMEGKAVLFKEFGGVDAFPICLDTTDTDEIVRVVTLLAPVFGGINLEDIASPRCFEIERRLRKALEIPVFHDDQHGTAIVVLAGLLNALRVVNKRLEDVRVVVTGVGAAGIAVTKTLLAAGVRDVVGCDSRGVVHRMRTNLNPAKREFAELTNPRGLAGTANEVLDGADVFIGLSQPGAVNANAVRTMAKDAIVFAMANPTPEVAPEEFDQGEIAVLATGRSDYPNQINNVLAFPGVFRGALDVRAKTINSAMELAAAHAIAAVVDEDHLSDDYIIPSVFNRDVAPAVAAAVAEAARHTGVARR
jgi:malate dehydrogenase (oxaloacetate-decarboxylating)